MNWKFWKKKKPSRTEAKDSLVFAFKDDEGVNYYRFPDGISMPLIRLYKVQEFMTWMVRGLSQDDLRDIANRMDELLTSGIKQGRNAAKLGVLISELTDRNERFVPVEIIYNYLAVFYIREDERFDIVNDQIQKEKVIAFKRSADSGDINSFFFALTEYKNLCELLNITKDKWEYFAQESAHQKEKMLKLLKITELDKS